MKGISHLGIGLLGTITFSLRVAPLWRDAQEAVVVLAIAGVASLLPDIDSGESIIRRATGTNASSGWGGKIISWLISTASGGHRVGFHAPLVWLLLSWIALVYFRGNMPGVAFCLGYGLHLLADALTIEGIPLFYPFSRRHFGIPLIRTGGRRESIAMTLIGIGNFLLWKH